MHCIKKITNDLTWVGANDRRLAMFEGVYSVPDGVSYNSYILLDEKTVLFDTVDKAVRQRFFENISKALGERKLDYMVLQHMEPDHSSAIREVIKLYPDVKVICNAKTMAMIKQFYDFDINHSIHLVNENDTLDTGRHKLRFIMAPMVHWPEVMVTYESTEKILFSADAFGCFGALNGALFADEVDFTKDYMDEARRYYANIVGKYGKQVEALLEKVSDIPVEMICPLHGFVWRQNIGDFVSKYLLWSTYTPEEYGVMIAYASVYGNTENAAEVLSAKLRDKGIKTQMFDVSVTPASDMVSAAFRWSHLAFASTTYNAGIFVAMENLLSDLTAHNIQNRTVAIIENGSWAATSGGLIREKFAKCKDINILENSVSLQSWLKTAQLAQLDAMADAIIGTFPDFAIMKKDYQSELKDPYMIDENTMFKLSYGLFVLTARDGAKDNGCIINTVTQITQTPLRMSIAVNKANYTHDMIQKTRQFNISILSTGAPFRIFQQFGFQSGKDADKFADCGYDARTANGIRYVPEHTNGVISANVANSFGYGTHTLFIADITQAFIVSDDPSVTYQYYFDHIKPKPRPPKGNRRGFVCKICGYVHEGEELPDDFICPICKHGAKDFEPIIY
jgi:flavorubredoxin/flavin reductase (DIM6/NTAB) family NADH-FMN oxidoreductase RutF